MPDISKATMYRHVGLLVAGGLLEVVDEQRVHSVLERRYRLNESETFVGPDKAASLSLDDHRRLFGVAMATLLAEFNSYLDRDRSDPAADKVAYPQLTLWLNPDELTEVINEVRDTIRSRVSNAPSPDRTPYLFSAILFPTDPSPDVS